jgi:cytochrome oxidase Cu insertion factor (SCO1/SenC/PrrC family)/copper(I)-binding protein
MSEHPPVDGSHGGDNPTGRRGGRYAAVAGLALAGAALLWIGLALKTPRSGLADTGEDTGFRGGVLREPMPKPAFMLQDMHGEPFDFAERTDGRLTLLFFGFTHCPDICPVHLANLAAVLDDLPQAVRRGIQVVFVTGDPERDTPERLQQWLAAFDPGFIGLYGSVDEVNAILADLRLPPLVHGPPDERGNYSVGHPAQILAFTPDGYLRVMYPFGTRQTDWAHDLPKLAAQFVTEPGEAPAVSLVRASMAYVPVPASDGPAALYATVRNRARLTDTLVGATTWVAGSVELHRHTGSTGSMMMERVDAVALEPRDSLVLAPGGYHLMLFDLTKPLAAGDTFTVELLFRRSGSVPLQAVVVPYAALERMLPAAQSGHAEH